MGGKAKTPTQTLHWLIRMRSIPSTAKNQLKHFRDNGWEEYYSKPVKERVTAKDTTRTNRTKDGDGITIRREQWEIRTTL